MISITSGQINAWIVAFSFPMFRIMAFLVTAPPFNNAALRNKTRLVFGLALTMVIAPIVEVSSSIDPASGMGLIIVAEQIVIGSAMGLAMRLVFSAIDMAGSMISLQMGLGFATAYDPSSASQTPVIAELIGILSLLMFLSLNGHLMVLSVLAQSFSVLPIGVLPHKASWLNVANTGGIVFSSGLMLALPVICALMITNIALGVLGRVSPQLNLMVIGFPITITLGFCAIYIGLSRISGPLQNMFEAGLFSMLRNFVIN